MTDKKAWYIMLAIVRATGTMAEFIGCTMSEGDKASAKEACDDLDKAMDDLRAWLTEKGEAPK